MNYDDSRQHCLRLRHVPIRRRPGGRAAGLRRDADHRARHLGSARGPRRDDPAAPAHPRAGHHLHRHRRLLRPQRLRGAHRGGAAPLRRRPGDRHEGRADPAGAEPLDRGRAAGVPPPAGRAEPAQAQGRPDRPVPAAPHRPRGPDGGPGRRAQGPAGRGQDPAPRPLRGLRRGAAGGPAGGGHRVGAEQVQPRRPRLPGAPRPLHGARHRLHPVAPGGRPRRRRGAAGGRGRTRRHRVTGRAGLAAAPLAGDGADPRHLHGRAPRGEHCCRRHRADRRRVRCACRPDASFPGYPGNPDDLGCCNTPDA